MLIRAVALQNMGLTDFVLQLALREAKSVIEEAEQVTLSERDTRLWLDLMDNPPKPNERLIACGLGRKKRAQKLSASH